MDLIVDFTCTYSKDWIGAHKEMNYMDCTGLRGTDMYCSPDSATELERRIAEYPLAGIHFIDSGNYHYMTRLFTKRVGCPYDLIVFDNHTDCKPSMIPELLSCGAWAKQVLEEDENLQRLILIGPPREAINEIEIDIGNREKLVTVSREELGSIRISEMTDPDVLYRLCRDKMPAEGLMHPLYLSIDKDVLDKEYAMTNWDQGGMSLDQLKAWLRFFSEENRKTGYGILAVDICGELPKKDSSVLEAAQAEKINQRTNEDLIDFIRKTLKFFS